MKITRKEALGLGLLFASVVLIGGCGSGHRGGGAGDAPGDLFGTWRLVEISGGFTGHGAPVSDPPDLVTFSDDGTRIKAGVGDTPGETRKYKVTHRKSLTGGDVVVPVIEYSDGSVAEIIAQVDGLTLRLTEDANDGYTLVYSRVLTGE